ncbi:MAG: glycosyltransferase family 1 protein [Deltaproteobacteria bacterium]|nr:MAG: glycosyltransferase family 1 protein [Deltaproteobacteria bacterium]
MKLHVWFISIRAGSGTDRFVERLAAGLEALGVRCTTTWLQARAELLPWLEKAPENPGQVDIVHVNTWLHPRFLPEGIPVVATAHLCVHGEEYRRYKSVAESIYHRFRVKPIERRILSRASTTVAVSRFTAEQYRKAFGIGAKVIYNGIDTGVFSPGSDGKPDGEFTLLFVGNLSRRKGADLLEPVMRRLGKGFRLVVASGLRKLPSGILLPEGSVLVRDCNTDEDMARVYRMADALLFPSRLEGLPFAVQEAMACGLPVIGSRIPSLVEALGEEQPSGILCDTDDVEQFANAARFLAEHSEEASRLGRLARGRAERMFGLRRMAEEYLETYVEAAEKGD